MVYVCRPAQELVAAGDGVVICGRDSERLAAAAAALRRHAEAGGAVHSLRCDVSNGHGALHRSPDYLTLLPFSSTINPCRYLRLRTPQMVDRPLLSF